MEGTPVIAGLLDKRAFIELGIAEVERAMRRRQSEVMQIDATILLFPLNLKRTKRDMTRFQRSAHFVRGELTRRCQTALRDTMGRAITADEIAVETILRQDIPRWFLWTLNRMLGCAVVTNQGWDAEAKWTAPLTPQQPSGDTLSR